ncbi:Thiamine pyrophosphate enzyme, N-terminal TPP binding domain [Actinacidiphila glaucinigra]|uniref:Thiamine pyrophosphate enzyme, N-terminal TPP binding domain n=1 Tax=Actinacidiphila glaucinigra TaxID=235986 RepID=A0A239N8Y0_9ACTN|nr:Thiamine pyrophosphate enzyme, N-terminal TPP binding domain [Actinacidiphila glaucinigra]
MVRHQSPPARQVSGGTQGLTSAMAGAIIRPVRAGVLEIGRSGHARRRIPAAGRSGRPSATAITASGCGVTAEASWRVRRHRKRPKRKLEGESPVSIKVSDHVLQRLREWDVDHVFAYPGDGINGLLAAWGRADDKPRFVQARHEEMAAFQAVGYAKFSGRVGVCAATSGPGAIHLLNGLYDAKLDHVPVVAIVGQTNRSAMGGSYQQEGRTRP